MTRFILRRLLTSIPVLLGIVLLVFILARVIPGDPCTATYGEKATPAICAAFEARYGLDKPIHEQFVIYFGRARAGRPRQLHPVRSAGRGRSWWSACR